VNPHSRYKVGEKEVACVVDEKKGIEKGKGGKLLVGFPNCQSIDAEKRSGGKKGSRGAAKSLDAGGDEIARSSKAFAGGESLRRGPQARLNRHQTKKFPKKGASGVGLNE